MLRDGEELYVRCLVIGPTSRTVFPPYTCMWTGSSSSTGPFSEATLTLEQEVFVVALLKVIDYEGDDITSLVHWSKLVRRGHWKPGRSAYSLADFILNRQGAAHLEYRLASVLSESVRLEQGTPEYAARFDGYEGPARLDLGISGQTASGQSLFVGLEAKVHEPFGSVTVEERYQLTLESLRGNPRSKSGSQDKGVVISVLWRQGRTG